MEKKSTKNIKTAFLLNFIFSIVELVGGIFTNSISIITDSLHDFCDSLSIAVSWFLERKSEKKPNKDYTYGYIRFSVLGAFISSTFLLVSSTIALLGSIPRIIKPEQINYDGVLILAVLGLAVNGLAAYKTAKANSLNEKAINLHLLEDVLGWASVLTIAIIMKIFNVPILDPILSILLAIFIVFRVLKELKAIFEVFLEKAPKDVDIKELKEHLVNNEFIEDIHHIHLWTLDGINKYITLHVIIKDSVEENVTICKQANETSKNNCLLREVIISVKKHIKEELEEHGINHSSIEIEFKNDECSSHECNVEADFNNHIGHNYNHHH